MIQSSEPLGERDLRQRQIVPPERLAACHALVIGVGAIGRQVALQLAAVGAPRLTLFDDDVVAVENLAPQGYWPSDLGTLKVHATRSLCERVNPEVQVTAVAERFRRSTACKLSSDEQLVVFVCVDSIATRKLLWDSLCRRADLYLDGRMSAEVRAGTGGRVAADRPPLRHDALRRGGGLCRFLHGKVDDLHGVHRRRTDAGPVDQVASRLPGRSRRDPEPAVDGPLRRGYVLSAVPAAPH